MRFSLRTFLISVAIVAVSLAVAIGRAESQRKAVQNIKVHGGYVAFNGEYFSIGQEVEEESFLSRSLIWNLRHSVTSTMIDKSDYEELREELMRLPSLNKIVVRNIDSDIELEGILDDFPNLEVVDRRAVFGLR